MKFSSKRLARAWGPPTHHNIRLVTSERRHTKQDCGIRARQTLKPSGVAQHVFCSICVSCQTVTKLYSMCLASERGRVIEMVRCGAGRGGGARQRLRPGPAVGRVTLVAGGGCLALSFSLRFCAPNDRGRAIF